MAFNAAAGYGNLPNGNFSPVIYSQKVLKFFKAVSVVDEITNTEFEGEIANFGDTVRIIKEPDIEVTDYVRGQVVLPQDIVDEDLTMTIDQAKKYAFRMDDIEARHSHVAFAKMAEETAAWKLRDVYDRNVLSLMATSATTSSGTGTSGSEVTVGFSGANFTPLNLINRLARMLDDNKVPDDGGRFMVANPQFYEWLGQEDSKYIEANTMGDSETFIRQRKVGAKPIAGLMLYKSVNAPKNAASKDVILCGHTAATATAKQILKSEVIRSSTTFADEYRGLFVFGRKVLRPEALFAAHVNFVA